ncbi:myomegalin-like [Emydura macquarii macquarii]|uniref:myomegalin-like n=1 Tax=Emydura macquarii macquarii TaxID=1129001 RepID=UPI00352B4F52
MSGCSVCFSPSLQDLGGRRLPALTGAVGQLMGRLVAAEAELRSLRAKMGGPPTEDVGVPSGPGPMRGQEWLLGPLARCLHSKEAALQDCLAALETLAPPGAEPPALETLVLHLCQRLKERDQALERHLADGASARAQDQRELTRLRETLRDKDADLGRLVAALRAGEQTVHALREMLEQKELEQGQLSSLCAVAQDAWCQQDQTRALALQEKEELVAALQAALTSSTKDMEVLAESLEGPSPGLLQRLREQEGLLAEALAERARLGAAMETRLQEALAAQAAAEQQLQDQLRGCTQALAERAQEAGALRGRLAQQAGALAEGATALAWCQAELAQVRGLLEERDQALLVLGLACGGSALPLPRPQLAPESPPTGDGTGLKLMGALWGMG